jgi:hypothetical protein
MKLPGSVFQGILDVFRQDLLAQLMDFLPRVTLTHIAALRQESCRNRQGGSTVPIDPRFPPVETTWQDDPPTMRINPVIHGQVAAGVDGNHACIHCRQGVRCTDTCGPRTPPSGAPLIGRHQ